VRAPPGRSAPGNLGRALSPEGPGAELLRSWERLRSLPGGKRLFSLFIGRRAPYTGSIRAVVQKLEPGRTVVTLVDRHSVRNHLRSVHAIALTNLGELSSGLAMLTVLPSGTRGIVVALEVEFHKKARGLLTAEGQAVTPAIDSLSDGDVESLATAVIRDAERDLVAEVRVRWRIGAVDSSGADPVPGLVASG